MSTDTITQTTEAFVPNATTDDGGRVQAIGRSEKHSVYRVRHEDGTAGWVKASGVTLDDDTPELPEHTNAADVLDLTQCGYKTAKGRRCKLAPGHSAEGPNDGHKMVLKSEVSAPKTLAAFRTENAEKFGAFTLESEEVPDADDLGREYNREIVRDEDQLKADKDALAAYNAWVAAGKPEKFEDLGTPDPEFGKPVRRYIFPPEFFDTIVMYLRRATQKGGPVSGKRLEYRRKTHESGNAMVYYRITDPTPSTPRTVAPAATPVAETPDPEARELAEQIVADGETEPTADDIATERAEARTPEELADIRSETDPAEFADQETAPEVPAETASQRRARLRREAAQAAAERMHARR